jgi:hypothetical protein
MAPVEIVFRGMSASPSVEAAIERWVERLELVDDRIRHCLVVVESPHALHPSFEVRLAIAISDQPMIVVKGAGGSAARANIYVAVADVFRAGRRRLVELQAPSLPAPSRVLGGAPRGEASGRASAKLDTSPYVDLVLCASAR